MGLIGLGLVGSALAERFAAAGFKVIGYDIDGGKVDALRETGMADAHTPREVAAQCRRVVLSLPNSYIVNEVVEGADGILEAARPGDVVMDTTTADPVMSVALAGRLRRKDIRFLDATILGSSRQVREADVIVMAGGAADVFASCRDIFSTFSRKAFHMGASGKGAEAKLVVNLVLGLNRLALAEGLTLGMKAGVHPERLLDVLREGAAYSRVMDTKGHKMVGGDFTPEARLAQHLKDVGLILDLGMRSGVKLPLSARHAQLLRAGVDAGYGEEDNSAIIKVFRDMAGGESEMKNEK